MKQQSRPIFWIALVALGVAGCGDTIVDPPMTGGARRGGVIGPVETIGLCDTGGSIMGYDVTTFVGDDTSTNVPNDHSASPIEALVQTGDQWKAFPGTRHADGSFEITGVPPGPLVVRSGTHYVITCSRSVSFDVDVPGRPRGGAEPVGPNNIVTNIKSLSSWVDGDLLELFSANTNGWAMGFNGPAPAAGATSLTGQKIDWSGNELMDFTKGDILYVSQLSRKMGPGAVPYNVITRFTSFKGLKEMDGVDLPVNGEFTTVTSDQSVPVDFRAADFVSNLKGVNPAASVDVSSLTISTQPVAGQAGASGYNADLFMLSLAPGAPNVDLGTLMFGNPFPTSGAWRIRVDANAYSKVTYTAPGATKPVVERARVSVTAPLTSLSEHPLRPVIGPVQFPQVNGQSAFSDLKGVTTTPTLSWGLPGLGRSNYYRVYVKQLDNQGGTSQSHTIADLTTTDTKLQLPPGILESGKTYFFVITAHNTSGDPLSHPFGAFLSDSTADVLTNMVTP
jgi:hypothetical protein